MQSEYSYLISIIKFAGIAIIIEWVIGYKYLKRFVKKILLIGFLGICITAPLEGFALTYKDYSFYPETTFNILVFGAEVETYLFSFLVSISVASATLLIISITQRKKVNSRRKK